jgi:hypothetical protein
MPDPYDFITSLGLQKASFRGPSTPKQCPNSRLPAILGVMKFSRSALKPISKWLFQHHQQFAVSILVYTDLGENWLPGLFDLELQFVYNDVLYAGRGQSFNKHLALEKAAAEALERLGLAEACRADHHIKNSSGFAAHLTSSEAYRRAKLELIERDVLMCNTLTGADFCELTPAELKASSPKFFKLSKRLRDRGIDLKVGELRSDFKERVFICAAFGENHSPSFGTNIGLGVSLNPHEAIEKAIQECLMMISRRLAGHTSRSLSLQTFLRVNKPDFTHHFRLGFNLKFAKAFRKRFRKHTAKHDSASRLLTVDKRLLVKFVGHKVQLPQEFKTCPIKIMRASNKDLQIVLLGDPTELQINKSRIHRFGSKLSPADRLSKFDQIHILG